MLLGVVQRRLKLVQPCAHARQQLQALFAHLHAASAAAKQRHLQVILEGLDLLAHRRGRHAERLGSATEAQMRCDRLEYTQRAERKAVVGFGHVKLTLMEGQLFRLFAR